MIPNMEALLALPARLGLRAVVMMSPENFAYASGSNVITVRLIRPRHGYVMITPAGAELIVCSIEKTLVQAESWIDTITVYTEFVDKPVAVLAARLKAQGIDSGRIGIDLDYLNKAAFDDLCNLLPNVEWVNTTEDVAAIRAVKTADEVAKLKMATCATHRAVLDAMADSTLGDTEAQMARRIMDGMLEGGADGVLFLCFASGDRTDQPHAHATDRVPAPGELIRFDVGATWGAWASDFARTYSTGEPTQLQRDTYRKLSEIQQETIEFIKPGVTAEAIFEVCKAGYEKRGLRFHMPHIGHSFGLELHESPMLRPGEKTLITEGMVLNIEPIVIDEKRGTYHLEDLVEVTSDGARLLTLGLAPREIPIIGTKIG